MDEKPDREVPLEPRFVSRLTGAQLDLYAFIRMLLGNRQDAQDVLQDTNVMLMRRLDDPNPFHQKQRGCGLPSPYTRRRQRV